MRFATLQTAFLLFNLFQYFALNHVEFCFISREMMSHYIGVCHFISGFAL